MGKDGPVPVEEFDQFRSDLFAVITCGWRFGSVADMSNLRVILEVGVAHQARSLDYNTCFQRGIRVLSCAPAFGSMVVEIALGQAIASARGIVVCWPQPIEPSEGVVA